MNTAEKRHQHNAIERQRRETLNSKFLSLARLLPSLASHRRPSKAAIVHGSVAHLTHQRDQRLLAVKLLRQLCTQHDELLNEVNEWRKANGYAVKDNSTAWTEEVEEVCSVEKEVFGNFATMGAEGDDDDDDNDIDMAHEMALDQVAATAASLANVNNDSTSRSSIEIDANAQSQTMFGDLPIVDKRPCTATTAVNALDWSSEFAFNMNSTSVGSISSSLPFGAYVSDSFEQSSPDSPTNSQPNNVLTPPTTGDISKYTHTPSPRAANGSNDKVNHYRPHHSDAWSSQQLLFLAQQHQHDQPQPHQHSQHVRSRPAEYVPTAPSHPSNFFPVVPSQHQQQPGTDAFTQSLLASMFPQNAATAEQVNHWRKVAVGRLLDQQQGQLQGVQPSLDELKVSGLTAMSGDSFADVDGQNALRAGMGFGLGMTGVWSEEQHPAVEGF